MIRIRTPLIMKSTGLLLASLLFSHGTLAASSYLQELEAEAAAGENTPTTQPAIASSPPNWSQQQAVLSDKLDPGLSKEKFEEELKKRFYGSYLFYSTLNDRKQEVVYQEYQKKNEIEYLRDVIKSQMTN